MKIKYFYQLLISHIGILILAFLILSLLFSQFVENYIFENKVEELNAYGEQVLSDVSSRLDGDERYLLHYSQMLNARNIRFFLFDSEGRVLFPEIQHQPLIQLTDQEWAQIKKGNKVSVRHDLKRFEQEVTLVALPHIIGGELAGGIMLLAPISGAVETISQLNEYLFYTIFISLAATILLSWILSKNLIKRITQLRNATSMISSGNYNVNIPNINLDEIDDLAADFNRMASRLKESNDEIDRLENRRRKFIADVSHELKTPLTTISGLVEGFKNDLIPGNEKDRGLDLIDREAKRLIRLVNENLDYEKIRSNQIRLNKVSINLYDIFELIEEQLSVLAREKGNRIIIDANEHDTVYADYDRFTQILINIVKNSIQFTTDGSITLRARNTGKETVIEIEDTGIGIDTNEIESIWDRFYKADLSRTSSMFGEFGLGLSIVKQLVQLHDGSINVVSEKEKGTKFTMVFPNE
ncbi:sensor histidine kinase [Bacillus sp. V3-13]|uniref:sensor histidine kinase n=1 Tax=Bacillus sp. V3-13 TaxID=2053728 RepID=UPI000C76AF95|nr:HAMP domain-containing sensor histidine kinase [Bacillus sp. V3-13]PLR77550.1 sensor histidine kinase [Bacillus sp. V3-13]